MPVNSGRPMCSATYVRGGLNKEPSQPDGAVARPMAETLRVHQKQTVAVWSDQSLQVALLDREGKNTSSGIATPTQSQDGRHRLWMAGEVFRLPSHWPVEDVVELETFLQVLLHALVNEGPNAVSQMDGEYVIVWWDSVDQRLTIINDRFGSLPLFWATASNGFAFANGVRGVLAVPGVSLAPDLEVQDENA